MGREGKANVVRPFVADQLQRIIVHSVSVTKGKNRGITNVSFYSFH